MTRDKAVANAKREAAALRRKADEIEATAATVTQYCSSPDCDSPADENGYGRCTFHWFWGDNW